MVDYLGCPLDTHNESDKRIQEGSTGTARENNLVGDMFWEKQI